MVAIMTYFQSLFLLSLIPLSGIYKQASVWAIMSYKSVALVLALYNLYLEIQESSKEIKYFWFQQDMKTKMHSKKYRFNLVTFLFLDI